MKIIPLLISISFSMMFALSAFAFSSWEQLTAAQFSVNPPAMRGSAVDFADIQEILRLQSSRTNDQCLEIESVGSANFKNLFKNAGILTDDEYSHVNKLMKKTGKLAHAINKEFKQVFHRERPADEDQRIIPCGESLLSSEFSYPSSHSAVATTVGCVLAVVFPNRATAFASYARMVGEKRVLGGKHHPSDIVAGEALGKAICQRLLKDGDYQHELKKIR